jgi:hypothetical protein
MRILPSVGSAICHCNLIFLEASAYPEHIEPIQIPRDRPELPSDLSRSAQPPGNPLLLGRNVDCCCTAFFRRDWISMAGFVRILLNATSTIISNHLLRYLMLKIYQRNITNWHKSIPPVEPPNFLLGNISTLAKVLINNG